MKIDVRKRSDLIRQQGGDINRIRDQLEQADVVLDDGRVFQAGVIDTTRMEAALENWAYIESMKDEEGRQLWKDSANNLHPMTLEEFQAFVTEVKAKRAARAARLFAYSDSAKAGLPLPADHAVFDPTNWPT